MMPLLPLLSTIGSGTILLFAASRGGSEKDAAKLPLLGSITFAA